MHSFDNSISFGVVAGGGGDVDSQEFAHVVEEVGFELGAVVAVYGLGEAVAAEDLSL